MIVILMNIRACVRACVLHVLYCACVLRNILCMLHACACVCGPHVSMLNHSSYACNALQYAWARHFCLFNKFLWSLLLILGTDSACF